MEAKNKSLLDTFKVSDWTKKITANQARASIKTNCFFAGLGFVIASASIMVEGTFAEIMAFQGHKSQLLVVQNYHLFTDNG